MTTRLLITPTSTETPYASGYYIWYIDTDIPTATYTNLSTLGLNLYLQLCSNDELMKLLDSSKYFLRIVVGSTADRTAIYLKVNLGSLLELVPAKAKALALSCPVDNSICQVFAAHAMRLYYVPKVQCIARSSNVLELIVRTAKRTESKEKQEAVMADKGILILTNN